MRSQTALGNLRIVIAVIIERLFGDDLVLTTIETTLATAAGQASRERTSGEAAALTSTLSPRERQVLRGILLC